MSTVTLDTNLVDDERLLTAALVAGFKVAHTTVTDRELLGSGIAAVEARRAQLFETGLVGESVAGAFVLGANEESINLEQILDIISSGSFPTAEKRKDLSNGQHRQLRDAMILCTHIREKREIFVTNDRKGFVDNGRRDLLEQRYRTRILTGKEFLRLCGVDDADKNV